MTEPSAGPVSRWFHSMMRSWIYQSIGRRSRPGKKLTDMPVLDEHVERLVRRVGWALAVMAPVAVAGALVLLREDIDRSTATLVLVLPVVVVAVVGGPWPAAVAALIAPLAFDVLLTQPYYEVRIHAAEDVEAMVILLAIGVLVGQLVAREARTRGGMTTRGSEVAALLSMIQATRAMGELPPAEQATKALQRIFTLRECRWAPEYQGGAYPRLTRSGEIGEGVRAGEGTLKDQAPLPRAGVELPVTDGNDELGHLILMPADDTAVSREERAVALAIADLLGLALGKGATFR